MGWPVPVRYLAGNHELYGQSWEQTRANLRRICVGTRIHFLDNDRVEIDGVRLLDATLWTDLHQEGFTQRTSMALVGRRLSDYHLITTQAGVLTTGQPWTIIDSRGNGWSENWPSRIRAGPWL